MKTWSVIRARSELNGSHHRRTGCAVLDGCCRDAGSRDFDLVGFGAFNFGEADAGASEPAGSPPAVA
jgi:hypothetical protein